MVDARDTKQPHVDVVVRAPGAQQQSPVYFQWKRVVSTVLRDDLDDLADSISLRNGLRAEG